MPIYIWRGTGITSVPLAAGKQDRKALSHNMRQLQSDMEPGHWGNIFLSDHWPHFIHGWHWLWKHLAAQFLWHPLEAVYSSPTQHAHTFVNAVNCCTYQPFRVLQQKLLQSLNVKAFIVKSLLQSWQCGELFYLALLGLSLWYTLD